MKPAALKVILIIAIVIAWITLLRHWHQWSSNVALGVMLVLILTYRSKRKPEKTDTLD